MASPPTWLRAYWFPLVLFVLSLFFQLIVIPRSYPPSHYDVLGIERHSSVEDVTEAYERLSSNWTAGTEVPPTLDFIKMRYAFELLTNPLWKRDYDLYGVDENIHVIAKVQEQYSTADFSEIDLPLLVPTAFDPKDQDFNLINAGNFRSKFESSKALLLQVFSFGSNRSAEFSEAWKRIGALLDGVATTGMVELGETQLVKYLAEKTFTGQPSFQNGLPSLVVFPSGCNASSCLIRFDGELSVDAVTEWFATTVLSLPRILYYSKESLAQRFLAKASPHKVKVIFFSETGERATPFVRKAAQDYWPYAAFANVLWREEDSSVWWNTFGVESAPAVVLLKESGVKPIVYHGSANESWFLNIMEQNKHHELPQLRSVTSKELGCDARGYSRAGNETEIWYCVIVTGRQSQELSKMRETMRRVTQELSSADKLDTIEDQPSPPVVALKEKRLTFTWLDGEPQQRYCFFLVQSPTSYDTCGTRKDIVDSPQIVIVRFKRNAIEDSVQVEKKPRNIFEALQDNDVDPASQLVARYNGSEDTSEIIKWISQIIQDGDSKDLPFFRAKAPELVPEDADPIWSKGVRSVMSKGTGVRQKISNAVIGTNNRLEDPRIGPVLLLAALLSFGNIWLRRNQTLENKESQPSGRDDDDRRNRRRNNTNVLNQDLPPSLTDMEPNDAVQMPLSDSD